MGKLDATLLVFFLAVVGEPEEGRSALIRRVGPVSSGGYLKELSVAEAPRLQFRKKTGEFKILQIADMHFANGKETECLDVFPDQLSSCSDLNTTAFVYRLIRAENPDFIVFTGDNIFGADSKDAAESLNAAFEPAVALKLPWAAVLGNHDQEGTLSREGVMRHIAGMRHSLSQLNPAGIDFIDGFGNYNLEVSGAEGSALANRSVLNLYFLDSGDYSDAPSIPGYSWIKPSQQIWFQKTSSRLRADLSSPGLAYFHIPLPEWGFFDGSNMTGVRQEEIGSAFLNSGFLATMAEAGDVKAAFSGHDHINDFCGSLVGIQICYSGGFGYHAYGKAGWARRARVVSADLQKAPSGEWGGVKSIKTWKRLDDDRLSTIDEQILWIKP